MLARPALPLIIASALQANTMDRPLEEFILKNSSNSSVGHLLLSTFGIQQVNKNTVLWLHCICWDI